MARAKKEKNPAAVELGRLGGKAPRKGPRGFAALPKKQVKEWSARGVAARKKRRRAA